MEEDNGPDNHIRNQVEEIIRNYEKKTVGSIPLNTLFPLLLNIAFRYKVREDIKEEDLDEIVSKLIEMGFPDALAEEATSEIYKIK